MLRVSKLKREMSHKLVSKYFKHGLSRTKANSEIAKILQFFKFVENGNDATITDVSHVRLMRLRSSTNYYAIVVEYILLVSNSKN